MADDVIQIAPDGSGKRLDAESFIRSSQTIYRERMQISGAANAEVTRVLNTDPTGTDYALITRQVEVINPKSSAASDVAIAAGGSTTLDSTLIPTGKTGKLIKIIASSSIPFKVTFQTVLDNASTTKIVDFTGPGERSWRLEPKTKEMYTVIRGGGSGFYGFRVIMTNLDTSEPADMYVSFEWDEV